MITINSLYIYLAIGLLIGFTVGFVSGLYISKKSEIRPEKVLGFVFFCIWVMLHIYGFFNNIAVSVIFDVVGAGSAGAMLGIKVSEQITQTIINKIKNDNKNV